MEVFLAVLLSVVAGDEPVEVVESGAGAALSSERRIESPHRIPVATIDVAKIFKEAGDFNKKMQSMKLEIADFDSTFDSNEKAKLREKFGEKSDPSAPALKSYVVVKKETFLAEETRAYAETYREIENAVQRICRERDIGLVIRSTSDSMDPKDRSSVLQGVNRPVVYTAVPDLTADVIAALNKSSQ